MTKGSFNYDGKRIVVATGNEVYILDLDQDKIIRKITNHMDMVTSAK
jgi:tricorn protease-like protein